MRKQRRNIELLLFLFFSFLLSSWASAYTSDQRNMIYIKGRWEGARRLREEKTRRKRREKKIREGTKTGEDRGELYIEFLGFSFLITWYGFLGHGKHRGMKRRKRDWEKAWKTSIVKKRWEKMRRSKKNMRKDEGRFRGLKKGINNKERHSHPKVLWPKAANSNITSEMWWVFKELKMESQLKFIFWKKFLEKIIH